MKLQIKQKVKTISKETLDFLKHLKQDLLTLFTLAKELNLMEEKMEENQTQVQEIREDVYLVIEAPEQVHPLLDDFLVDQFIPSPEDFDIGI